MKKLAILFAGGILFASSYEVSGAIGRNGVSNSFLSDYNFLNVRVGKYLPKNHILRVELERSEKFSNTHLTRALLNVEHYFDISSKVTPYAFVGIGYQWVSGSYDNNYVGDIGIGAKVEIKKNLGVFVEYRGVRDFLNNDNHTGFLVGISYKFGEKKPQQEPQKVYVLDDDNDGVSNAKDFCPDTPKGVKVNKSGCPIDSDKDGIADYLDKCPDTPKGVKVNKNGCPVDSDKDGVADYLDKCPNTPKGFEVDKNGCAIMFNFNVTFDKNSANLKQNSISQIQKFAEFLKKHPNIKAKIEGFTDSSGDKTYNKILSEKRAKAVYEELIRLGVSADRLSYEGYGDKNPIASNDTKEGREKNRRVVAKLIYESDR